MLWGARTGRVSVLPCWTEQCLVTWNPPLTAGCTEMVMSMLSPPGSRPSLGSKTTTGPSPSAGSCQRKYVGAA